MARVSKAVVDWPPNLFGRQQSQTQTVPFQILLPLVELSNSIQHHATKLHWYGCQHGNVQDRQGQGCPTKAASYCHEGNFWTSWPALNEFHRLISSSFFYFVRPFDPKRITLHTTKMQNAPWEISLESKLADHLAKTSTLVSPRSFELQPNRSHLPKLPLKQHTFLVQYSLSLSTNRLA